MIREGALFLEFHLVGESFSNDDGSSRQTEIARCQVGEPVTFTLQPDNPHDPNAILCVSARGVGLGHVPKSLCEQVKDALDSNFYEKARVAHVIGGVPGKPSRGIMIALTAKGSRYRFGGKVPFNPDWRGMQAYRPKQAVPTTNKAGCAPMLAIALIPSVILGLTLSACGTADSRSVGTARKVIASQFTGDVNPVIENETVLRGRSPSGVVSVCGWVSGAPSGRRRFVAELSGNPHAIISGGAYDDADIWAMTETACTGPAMCRYVFKGLQTKEFTECVGSNP